MKCICRYRYQNINNKFINSKNSSKAKYFTDKNNSIYNYEGNAAIFITRTCRGLDINITLPYKRPLRKAHQMTLIIHRDGFFVLFGKKVSVYDRSERLHFFSSLSLLCHLSPSSSPSTRVCSPFLSWMRNSYKKIHRD